jgi:phosphonate transport system permease protein
MIAPSAVRKVFLRRNLVTLAGLVAVAAFSYGSSVLTDFDFLACLKAFPKALSWIAANFIPDAKAMRILPKALMKLSETLLVSVMATVLAAALSFFLALMASRTTRVSPVVAGAVRLFASLCRNIPVVAWAMIFLLSFGQCALTGLLALLIGTVGILTRAFAETVEETADSAVEAVRATGANWSQTISQAVVPSILPQVASWMLYMIETNIRDATLVGILTGTGIGFLFDLYYKSMNYGSACLVVLLIVAAVILIEMASNALRKVIL